MTGEARRAMVPSMNSVLLILRLALAWYLATRGTTKLAAWLGGRGSKAALAAGALELGGGILLGLGLFTPLAGLLAVAVTANLVFVSWPHEFPLYVLSAAVAIALAGPGGYLIVGLGLAGAATMEGMRRLNRYRGAPAEQR
jgi:uncharacterized membrane protein YphA (DoxX/SURF4 family)